MGRVGKGLALKPAQRVESNSKWPRRVAAHRQESRDLSHRPRNVFVFFLVLPGGSFFCCCCTFFPFFLLFSLSLSLPPSRLIYNCSSPNDRFPIMKWRLTSRYSSPQRSKPSNRADLPYRYRVFVLSFLVFFIASALTTSIVPFH